MARQALIGGAVLVAVGAVALIPVPATAMHNAQATPATAAEAVAQAVTSFEAAFGSPDDCIPDPQIRFEILPGRKGEYRQADGTIVINPNRPVDTMLGTLVHELAHHYMVSCTIDLDAQFTERFYQAQGIPFSRSWFDYSDSWSATPAEHFAEAVVSYTLGTNDNRIPITEAGRDIIADLAAQQRRTPQVRVFEKPRPVKPDVTRLLEARYPHPPSTGERRTDVSRYMNAAIRPPEAAGISDGLISIGKTDRYNVRGAAA